MRILGIVVLYKPDLVQLVLNINQYIGFIDNLVVWRNSILTKDNENFILDNIECSSKIHFLGDGNNMGIGFALNQAVKMLDDKYDYLLTMDQDSYWVNFSDYIKTIDQYASGDNLIFGPRTLNKLQNEKVSWIENNAPNIVKRDYVITSGALYNKTVFNKVGTFKENYFIDAIDEEICFRARKFGIDTLCVNNAFIEQEFGNNKRYQLLGKSVQSSNYSSFRCYYISRNHIWLYRSGLLGKDEKKKIIHNYVIAPFFKVILFEDNKLSKMLAFAKGIIAGFFTSEVKEN